MATAKMLHHFQFQTEMSYHFVYFFWVYLLYHVVFNIAVIVVGVVGDVVVVGVQDWQSIRNNNFMDVLLGSLGIQA